MREELLIDGADGRRWINLEGWTGWEGCGACFKAEVH